MSKTVRSTVSPGALHLDLSRSDTGIIVRARRKSEYLIGLAVADELGLSCDPVELAKAVVSLLTNEEREKAGL